MKHIPLRHGDWGFYPTNKELTGEKVILTSNEFTWGLGEKTGHNHTLHTERIEDMEWYPQPDGSYLVKINAEAWATHPQHSLKGDLKVAPGVYRVQQSREKDWFSLATRKIVD